MVPQTMRDIWRRAWRDTHSQWKPELLLLLITLLLTYIAMRKLWTPEVALQSVTEIGASVLGVLIMAVLIFGWNLWHAPYRIMVDALKNATAKLEAQHQELSVLHTRLEPHIALVFDPADGQCFFTSSEADAIVAESAFRILRIKVANTSASRLERVRVLVTELGQSMPWGAQPLQFQHDLQPEIPHGAVRTTPWNRYPHSIHGFDFAPHERGYVELLSKKSTGHGSDQFTMSFAEGIPAEIPATPRRIVVEAYSDNSLPTTLALRILLDDEGLPYAEPEINSA